ncbi:MAG: VOC family protein, partial [Actinomycetota bacterium]|nr:VOC family protein [Actinomycetota bacterium]
MMDPETGEQVRELMAKGFAGTIFLTTDDCYASYEELKSRGVEFVQEPTEQPYGIDAGFRDPSGNQFRMALAKAMIPPEVVMLRRSRSGLRGRMEAWESTRGTFSAVVVVDADVPTYLNGDGPRSAG